MTKKRQPAAAQALDKDFGHAHTETMLQRSGNNETGGEPETAAAQGDLMDLKQGDAAILERIELPADDARRLMELGFLPGTQVVAGFSAPGGDPRVFQVDGSEFALRGDTARRVKIGPVKRAKGAKRQGTKQRNP